MVLATLLVRDINLPTQKRVPLLVASKTHRGIYTVMKVPEILLWILAMRDIGPGVSLVSDVIGVTLC